MTCALLFRDTVAKLLEIAVSRSRLPGTWKFSLLARKGMSYFLEDVDRDKGFSGTGLDMGNGGVVPAGLADLPRAAKMFRRNDFIGIYGGPPLPIDELAKKFYNPLGVSSIPEFCQVGLDRPVMVDLVSSGMREHTDLIFIGLESPELLQTLRTVPVGDWVLEEPPAASPHWCSERLYRS
jgi:hypothetical protein